MSKKNPIERESRAKDMVEEKAKYAALLKRSHEISRQADVAIRNSGQLSALLAAHPQLYIAEMEKMIKQYKDILRKEFKAEDKEDKTVLINRIEYTQEELRENIQDLNRRITILKSILENKDVSHDDLMWLREVKEFEGLVDEYMKTQHQQP